MPASRTDGNEVNALPPPRRIWPFTVGQARARTHTQQTHFCCQGNWPKSFLSNPTFRIVLLVWSSPNPRRHARNHRVFRRCIIFFEGYSNCRPSRVGGYPILLPLASNRPFNAPICILHPSWPSRSSAFDQDVLDRCFIIIETAM